MKNLTNIEETTKFILNEGKITRTICIFPGRFQPFGPHHFESWRHLAEKFGPNNVFIATSDVVDGETSPLNFEQKRQIIKSYKIQDVVQVRNPYKAVEITEQFPAESTAVVFAYGEKDYGRLKFEKVDGTPGYFKPFEEGNLDPLLLHGYAYLIPNQLSETGQLESSTNLREFLKTATFESFIERYPNLVDVYDKFGARQIFAAYSKFFSKKQTMSELFETVIKSGSKSKHLQHPWEDESLSYADIRELIGNALRGNLDYSTEKVDGQNLMMTWRRGEFLFARNKTQILNPVSAQDMVNHFAHLPHVQSAFSQTISKLLAELKKVEPYYLQRVFSPGIRYLNFEVIHPESRNVIYYGEQMAVFHSINEYDEYGNEIGRYLQLPAELISNLKNPKMRIIQNKLTLQPVPAVDEQYRLHIGELNRIWKKYGLSMSQTLGDLYYEIDPKISTVTSVKAKETLLRECYKAIDKLFISLGAQVLKNIKNPICGDPDMCLKLIRQELALIRNSVEKTGDPEKIKKINYQQSRIDGSGGMDFLVPMEGIVFSFKGKVFKLTGLFGPINQILGMIRYNRG